MDQVQRLGAGQGRPDLDDGRGAYQIELPIPYTHTFQLVFTPSRPPQTGFPLRWTTDEESSDLYSPNNDEQPHLWELEVYMDCDALAESDGYFAFSAYMVDSTNNNSVEEENEVDQDVCEGGIDEGMEDNAERRVHYGL